MDRTYWQKQTLKSPLFDGIIWGKPQRKDLLGKLLVVGGNSHAIGVPSSAFNIALEQGVGECKVAMPDKTRKLLGPKPPPNIELVASNPSGSFSSKAAIELKNQILSVNATIFAGDFGQNSETAILLEKLLGLPGLQTYSDDSLDYFITKPLPILRRKDTLLVLDTTQLQKIALHAKLSHTFTHDMELLQFIDRLHEFTNMFCCNILISHKDQMLVASSGQVISTKVEAKANNWQITYATAATVWWLQNPSQPLQAISTAITQASI